MSQKHSTQGRFETRARAGYNGKNTVGGQERNHRINPGGLLTSLIGTGNTGVKLEARIMSWKRGVKRVVGHVRGPKRQPGDGKNGETHRGERVLTEHTEKTKN